MVVVIDVEGASGGGAETTCDSGSDAQPAIRLIAAQIARDGANDVQGFLGRRNNMGLFMG